MYCDTSALFINKYILPNIVAILYTIIFVKTKTFVVKMQ